MAAGPLADRSTPLRLPERLALAGLAAVGAALALVGAALLRVPGWFNDFTTYYLAGRVVADGRSPYDSDALAALGRSLGLEFVVGGGYSYPPPFAVAMAPLSALPFVAAVGLFTLVSVAAFGATIATWLPRVLPGVGASVRRRRALLALGAGLYPPVAGSVLAGQANLLVVALLGFGLAPFIPGGPATADDAAGEAPARLRAVRLTAGGIAAGLAAIVKLAPLALALPLALAAFRLRAAALTLAGLALGVVGSLVLAAVAAPTASRGAGGLTGLFGPDPFWTNQSINGAISRLFLPGDRTSAVLTGDPAPWIAIATAGLAILTAAALVRALPPGIVPTRRALALGLALSLVAAAVGAPKNSFWNHAPVVLAIGLAIAAGGVPATRVRRALLAVWLAATVAEVVVDRSLALAVAPPSPLLTLASDCATVALLALWSALAAALVERPDPSAVPAPASSPVASPGSPVVDRSGMHDP